MNASDRDLMIRSALRPSAEVLAPADLGDSIYNEIVRTPQRRGLVRLGRLGWLPAPSPLLGTLVLLALLAVALVIVVLSRPTSPPILAMYHGGPDRTGVMPGPGPVGEPVIQWDVPRLGALPFNSMPVPADGRLIVGDDSGALAALDQDTGMVVWEEDVGSPIRGSPAMNDALVFVGTESGEVVAAPATGGGLAWRRDLESGPVLASLLVADDVLYAGTDAGILFALDPAIGAEQWKLDVGGAVTRGPAFGDGVLYVGAAGGRFSAIDVATHAIRWTADLGAGEVGTPTLGNGLVYAGRGLLAADSDHALVAMNVADGSTAWQWTSPGGGQAHMGGLAAGRAYAATDDGTLAALDALTGEEIWTNRFGQKLPNLVSIVDDVLYVSAEPRSVRAVDARSGFELWNVEVVGNASMPAVVGGRVFVGTNLGRVVAIGGSDRNSAAP
jgi:outer membrane protein assembly factor BamB